MTLLDDGFGGYLALALAGTLMTQMWRWMGYAIGRNLSIESEIFIWVRAVATALVAGLVTRMLLFPAGALAGVPPWIRAAAFAAGIAIFFAARRSLAAGVIGGVMVLVGLTVV
jgi:Branched-chain amino acid transport protein (AzlD)